MVDDNEIAPGRARSAKESFLRTARAVRRHRLVGLIFNIAPSAFWLGVFFLVPLAFMLVYSFGTRGAFGEVLLAPEYLGLQQYRMFFVPEGATALQAVWYTLAWMLEWIIPGDAQLAPVDPTPYVQLTIRSINYGIVTTVVSFLMGYPIAYYLVRYIPDQRRNLLIALIVLPYWASYLVRVYAIKLLLSENGLIPSLLVSVGLTETAPQLMFRDFSVIVGLVYIWLPFMVLPIYSSIENLDFTLHEAAMDLGGDRVDAFLRVTLPLSMPGIIAGSVLVFIPSVGAYVIPELLGGPSTVTIGKFIASQFGAAGNWPLGAAASFILMVIMLVSIGLYQRYAGGDML
jgi:spermidine/putrescine transport system permease protein